MTKKEIAIAFLELAGLGQVSKAFEDYVSPSFIHHNQYFEGSRLALLNAMTEAHATSPNKLIEIKQCLMEGENVVTHSLVRKKDMDIAVVHIFRFENNKIAELWDLGQIMDKNSPNKHGLF